MSKVLDLEEDIIEISLIYEKNFLNDNSHILNDLKDKSNIVSIR